MLIEINNIVHVKLTLHLQEFRKLTGMGQSLTVKLGVRKFGKTYRSLVFDE